MNGPILLFCQQVQLFGEIVAGDLSESVFHDWLTTQTLITEALQEQQTEEVRWVISLAIQMYVLYVSYTV